MARSWKILLALCAALTAVTRSSMADDVTLSGIKVNTIGNKTRVCFLFDSPVEYSVNYLERPYRVIMDFQGHIKSSMDQVGVFNVGFVRNVRSYFQEKDRDTKAYALDACVIEVNRKVHTDIFWQGNTLNMDMTDHEVKSQADASEQKKIENKQLAEKLFQEGVALSEKNEYESALKSFEDSLAADDSLPETRKYIRRTKKLLEKKNKEMKIEVYMLEKKLKEKLKKEKKESSEIEKDIIKKKRDNLDATMDILELEQKGASFYWKKDYAKALYFWDQALQMDPSNNRVADMIAKARQEKAAAAGEKKSLKRIKPEKEPDGSTEKERKRYPVIGRPDIQEYSDRICLAFPLDSKISFRYGELKNPFRIMIYFKEDVLSDIPASLDISRRSVKNIRAYISPGSVPSDQDKAKQKITALVVETSEPCRYEVQSSDRIMEISFYKSADGASPVTLPEHPVPEERTSP